MGKQLVITEKPSVARDICAVLGGFDDEGDYFENDDYVVTFAVGHLLTLAEPQDYDKELRAWTIKTLPIIPDAFKLKPRDGHKKRLDMIKKLGRRKDIDGLINACDAGREGEIIFRRIIEYTKLDDRPHRRLWLQSMTARAITEAFEHLDEGSKYDPLGDAAWLRGVGDWLVGMNATRALTKRLKGRRERGAWSAGRVQTPTLGLLVSREREIFAHVPRTYWEIVAQFSHEDQTWEGHYHDASKSKNPDRDIRPRRIFERERVEQVLAALAANDRGVASEKRKKSKQNPPLPFDLTSLQREANRRFSFSAKRTLNAAQRLYEGHKLLTYPRTDSRYLPDDYGETIDKVLGALQVDAEYRDLADGIVENGPLNLKRILDGSKVSDHFAIVPTGAEPPTGLGSDDSRIYDLVVRQFLASLMGPATWATVERLVEVEVADGDNAIFRKTARSLEIPGFLEALGQEAEAGNQLPALVPGQQTSGDVDVAVLEGADEEKLTKPRSRYTESALLRLMETAGELIDDEDLAEAMKGRGLGTPATRADTIERLVKTGYARRIDGKLGPSPKGMRLMDILERLQVPVLAEASLTGQWEHALLQVQQGERKRDEVLDDLVSFTRQITESLTQFDHDELFAADDDLGPCPSCGVGKVVETAWGYRCSRNTQKEPECKLIIWKDRAGRYIDRHLAKKLVADKKSERIDGFTDRYGRSMDGVIFLEPDDDAPGSQWTMRIEFGEATGKDAEPEVPGGVVMPCPCENEACPGIVETNLRFVCSLFMERKEKRGPVLPKVVCQRLMDIDEVRPFFSEEARTGFMEGFISRRGRPFTGLLFRKPTGKHGFEFPPRASKSEDGEEAKPKRKRKTKAKTKPKAKRAKAKPKTTRGKAKPKATATTSAATEEVAKPAKSTKKKGKAKRSRRAVRSVKTEGESTDTASS